LHLGYDFNHPLPPLPSSLKILYLGQSFSHPLPPSLPASLKKLYLRKNFNHPLPLLNQFFDLSHFQMV
jgi:hypothetical protein